MDLNILEVPLFWDSACKWRNLIFWLYECDWHFPLRFPVSYLSFIPSATLRHILDTLEHLKLFCESAFRQLHWDYWLCHQWESGMSKGRMLTWIRWNYLSSKNIGCSPPRSLDCRWWVTILGDELMEKYESRAFSSPSHLLQMITGF